GVVSERLAELRDRASQRVRGNKRIPPHRVEQLLLGDQPVPMRDEEAKQVEHFRFDVDRVTGPPHRHAVEVDVYVAEFAGSQFGQNSSSVAAEIIIRPALNHLSTMTTRRVTDPHAASTEKRPRRLRENPSYRTNWSRRGECRGARAGRRHRPTRS